MSALRRRPAGTVAILAAVALALAPSTAIANDDAPDKPLETRGTANSVGQSVQIRTNADGTPNSAVTDFRWSVTQITAQGEPGADITVAVPEQGLLLHNLQQFGTIPQEDGDGLFDISLDDAGFGTARGVSLVPPEDMELPVAITTEFTLDGEPITAEDLVGRDGVVTAKYTITNRTREDLTVPITSVTGEEVIKEVAADVPMVVEAVTLLPTRYGALNTGSGLAGADGRGNWQVKWIALPFAPLSKDGTASFGWAANVTDAVIPSMLVQVLPIYIPEGEGGGSAPVSEEARRAAREAVPPPDISGDVDAIKSGVTDVITGLETLTAGGGGEDPLTTVEGRVNDFFTEFGTNVETISTLVDPNNPEGATALVKDLQASVDKAQQQITALEESGTIEKVQKAAAILTPANAQLLVDLSGPVNQLADNAESISLIAENAETIAALAGYADEIALLAENASTIADFIRFAGSLPTAVLTTLIREACADLGGQPAAVCDDPAATAALLKSDEVQQAADILESDTFQRAAEILNSTEFQTAADVIGSEQFQTAARVIATPEFAAAAAALEKAAPSLVPVAEALQVIDEQLPGIVTTLGPVLDALDGVLAQLEAALVGLSSQMQIIGEGIAGKNVELPTLDAVLAEITAQILASPGGQQVTGGLDQINAGISGAKTQIGSYVAELAVALQAAKAQVDEAVAEGKEVAGAVVERADTLKAEVAGLVMAAHQSPLPYGGDPSEAPEGTKLAGAYEFRMDPADTEAPSTLPRVLLSIVLLVGAGLLASVLANRRTAAAAGAGLVFAGGDAAATPADLSAPAGADGSEATAALPVPPVDGPDPDSPDPDSPDPDGPVPDLPGSAEGGDLPGGDQKP
jgi:hypothetical protein